MITDFALDAGASSVGSRALEYRWDWENDGTWDTGWTSDPTATHRFDQAETVTVAVQVENDGRMDVARTNITLDMEHGSVAGTMTTPVAHVLCLGYGDDRLWVSNWDGWPPDICEVDPATGSEVYTFSAPSNWPGGIAWDGTSLWVLDFSGGAKLFEMDPDDGTENSNFPVVYSYYPGGLAWDGDYFYVGSYQASRDNGDGRIHKYTHDGTHVGSFASPRGSVVPYGIAFDGEDLWVAIADADTLYVVDRDDGAVLRTVAVPTGTGRLAVDGTHLLLARGSGELQRIVP